MHKIHKIAIVGGGTSAWLAAAYISKNCPYFEIVVIDKEIGTPVGVGEGTLMNFKPFMASCGFDFLEWFPECDATYKAGVLFPGWIKKGYEIWHPFLINPTLSNGITLHNNWSCAQEFEFKHYGVALYDISVKHNKIDPNVEYAYHVDATKLVLYIQKKLKDKVTLIKSEMVDIKRDSKNNISSLFLANGLEVEADLFIDCTGFKGLLNFKPDRVSLEDRLICDTALAGQIQYIDKFNEQKPYVICEAVECGWIWTIPVKSRMGSGLVFNREITSIEKAKEYLLSYWGGRLEESALRVIDWTPFYNNNMWHENVVAIGLSAGFLEPLESTGIALIMEGIYQLVLRIRDMNYTDNDHVIYNSILKSFFEESINFVSMHYAYTERTEQFWSEVKKRIKVTSEQIFYQNQLLNPNVPMPQAGKDTNFFTGNNWTVWLVQMGYRVVPRNIPFTYAHQSVVENWHDNFEKFRHHHGIKHSDYIDQIHYLHSKYVKQN